MERIARITAWIMLGMVVLPVVRRAEAQDWARDIFKETSFDFGAVARGAKVEHRFPVENIFVEDAHIKSARASCGCTSPEVPTQILKTWNKSYVLVKIDTVNFQGQKDVTVTVEFDKPYKAEVQLNIHCYIRSDVVLDPGAVHLRAAQGSAARQRVIVRYAGRPDWQIQRVESSTPSIIGRVTEVSRGNGYVTYDLAVDLAAGTPVGYIRDELNLITNDPNPRAQRVPVPVDAVVLAPVTVHPTPLIMGSAAVGKLNAPVARPLIVLSQTPFNITRVESSDPHFRCDLPAAAAPATSHRLAVNFLGGETAGKLGTRIRIYTTASTDPVEADVSIELTQSGSTETTADKPAAEGKSEDKSVDPIFGRPGTAAKPSNTTHQEL
jgi:hypothetical protein